jgi:hypothetical protein
MLNGLETLKFRSNVVLRRCEKRRRESPFGVGRDDLRALRACHRNRGARDRESLCINDAPCDGPGRFLRGRADGSDEKGRDKNRREADSHVSDSSVGKHNVPNVGKSGFGAYQARAVFARRSDGTRPVTVSTARVHATEATRRKKAFLLSANRKIIRCAGHRLRSSASKVGRLRL